MTVRPLSAPGRLAGNLIRLSKRSRLPLLETRLEKPDLLLIIGDGDRDAKVAAAILHRIAGGSQVVGGLVIPAGEKGLPSIPRSLAASAPRDQASVIAVALVDQERMAVEEAWGLLERHLRGIGFSCERLSEARNHRLGEYVCEKQRLRIRLIVALNGLNRDYEVHTIEDHLIEVLRRVRPDIPEVRGGDPKSSLEGLLDEVSAGVEDLLVEVCRMRVSDLEEIFPQQVEAVRRAVEALRGRRSSQSNAF